MVLNSILCFLGIKDRVNLSKMIDMIDMHFASSKNFCFLSDNFLVYLYLIVSAQISDIHTFLNSSRAVIELLPFSRKP